MSIDKLFSYPETTITPGQLEFRCPHCHTDASTCYAIDGDSVDIGIDDATVIANGLACSWLDHSYHAVLDAYVCPSCSREFASLKLSLIRNPAVSEAWANAYFWLNEVTPEIPAHFIVNRDCGDGVSLRWRMDATQTPEGLLTEHYLGPVTPGGISLFGENGVSRCGRSKTWSFAAAMTRFALITATKNDFYERCCRAVSRDQ